ncbi:hypothetical protein IE81DRAFT_350430 [Ceraceosorus guamensis]|uniref:Cation/H+ exchanger transmembrane domain-containing protein n=1 Tax=Ceraceosorus guamensis TaxID=1522189 RepID=A0A316VP95_9BASI|nr:hypothetical protein IE81DRAFT_350430 [Ceraceosorus guamensis]PWN39134.1 hypothetical protein IE81DRAFT_350430 [Ceraceosorus guamensis]
MDALPYTEPDWVLLLIIAAFIVGLSLLHWALSATLYAGLLGQLLLGAVFGTPLLRLLPQTFEHTAQQLGYVGLLLLIARGGSETRLDVLSQPRNLLLSILVGLTGIGLPIGLSFALLTSPAYGYSTLQAFSTGAALSATSLGTVFAVLEALSQSLKSEESTPDQCGHLEQTAPKDHALIQEIGALASGNEDTAIHGGPSAASPAAINTAQGDAAHKSSAPRCEPKQTSQLGNSRIVSILVSAALLDDVIGLVLASVVTSLGHAESAEAAPSTSRWPLARPVVASFALILVTVIVCRLVACVALLLARRSKRSRSEVQATRTHRILLNFVKTHASSISSLLLIACICSFVAIAHVSGSTMLLGAFCAGASTTWLHSRLVEIRRTVAEEHVTINSTVTASLPNQLEPGKAWAKLEEITAYILVPFFFSSIGMAIPVRQLFTPSVVWKGWVYACVMAFAKVLPGLWILLAQRLEGALSRRVEAPNHVTRTSPPQATFRPGAERLGEASDSIALDVELRAASQDFTARASVVPSDGAVRSAWRPALLLGLCLVSRGEVGFIIINLAREAGILPASSPQGNDAFNIGIWAIVLNTLFGPLAVGFFLKSKMTTKANDRTRLHRSSQDENARETRSSVAQSILRGPWGAA